MLLGRRADHIRCLGKGGSRTLLGGGQITYAASHQLGASAVGVGGGTTHDWAKLRVGLGYALEITSEKGNANLFDVS